MHTIQQKVPDSYGIDSCGTVLSVSGQGGKLPDRCDRKPQKMYYVVKTIVPL